MKRFEGKIALVTGGGRGIGKAVVERYVAEGASVMAVSTGSTAEAVAAKLGSAVVPHACDVSDEAQVKSMVDACRKRFGRLDVLCNNAGIGHPRRVPIHEVDLAAWQQTIDVNLTGAFLVLKHAIPLMIASGGGAIVNMSSVGAFRAGMHSTAYRVSKAGLVMLTRQAAVEYAKDKIRVNAVCPGTTKTDILAHLKPEDLAQRANCPLGRIGTPEEVAALTAFLSSDEAAFITGAAYLIDGGRDAVM